MTDVLDKIRKRKIQNFIKELVETKSTKTFTNPYNSGDVYDKCRQEYLRNYLFFICHELSMSNDVSPRILLVGEAPGKNGALVSGIPFTDGENANKHFHTIGSSELVSSDITDMSTTSTNIKTVQNSKELSANTMWKVFDKYEYIPIMWNAFPFQPHQINSNKNRTPTKEEIDTIGKHFLELFLDIFAGREIYAIGRNASVILTDMGIEHKYIRHPSHGGALVCKTELSKIIKAELKNKLFENSL